ncbi:MAG: transposase [Bacteroidetes bacterium]|nr:transposase [Bacteroidota bacterium]
MMLVGYLENINSDRRVIAFASMRLDILLFIGYDIDEPLPWHSTLSRTRQLYGESVFLKLFQKVLLWALVKEWLEESDKPLIAHLLKPTPAWIALLKTGS